METTFTPGEKRLLRQTTYATELTDVDVEDLTPLDARQLLWELLEVTWNKARTESVATAELIKTTVRKLAKIVSETYN